MIQYIFYPQILNPITLLSGMEDNSRIVSRLIAPSFNNSNLVFAGGRSILSRSTCIISSEKDFRWLAGCIPDPGIPFDIEDKENIDGDVCFDAYIMLMRRLL